jgi:hypothetical protein
VKAIVKGSISPDVNDLENYIAPDSANFGFLMQLLIGPENEEGFESFDIVVCTPQWLSETHASDDIIIGRHHLIVFEYNYDRILKKINSYIEELNENTWPALAQKIARLGKWEFEDYTS